MILLKVNCNFTVFRLLTSDVGISSLQLFLSGMSNDNNGTKQTENVYLDVATNCIQPKKIRKFCTVDNSNYVHRIRFLKKYSHNKLIYASKRQSIKWESHEML